jgi:uncharacterized protein (TIGR02466 family)|tara:strand:+ start:1783 stop:2463 length:681 start_codon:yes stop_codon:yes gene_type:complete
MISLEHLVYHKDLGDDYINGVVALRPFGPAIGYSQMPDEVIDAFNADIDNGEKQDWSDKLVGKVDAESLIPTDVLQPHAKFFTNAALEYVDNYAGRYCKPIRADIKPTVNIHSAWYVQQKAGNFNPLHIHTNAELSCVGYLALPEGIDEEWAEEDADHYPAAGHIEFLHGSQTFLSRSTFMVRPKVGDFFIFPADLMHTVYPFKCAGERRSFSMNIVIGEKEPEEA